MGLFDDILASQKRDGAVSGAVTTGGGLYSDVLGDKASEKLNNANISTTEDVVRSGIAGVERGIAGAPGVFGDISNLSKAGGRMLGFEPPQRSMLDALVSKVGLERLPTSSDTIEFARQSGVSGIDYQPKTMAGEYARTIGENFPGSFIGPGGAVRNALLFGVAPAVASETAGQFTKGTEAEPWARAGAALATGGTAAFATRPGAADRAVMAATRDMTPQDVEAAIRLFRESRAGSTPVPLTMAEAAGNERMLNLQRVVEGQGGLSDFMAQRPAQVDAAGRGFVDTVAPVRNDPSMLGREIQRDSQGIVGDVTRAINARTAPLYRAAEFDSVPANQITTLQSDPIFANTIREIRNDPTLNRTIANLPDDNPVVLDLVQRRLGEIADNARMPGQATTSNTRASNIGAVQENVRNIADNSSQNLTIARAENARLRQQYLEPLMAGPIGKLQNTDEVKGAINALFPQNPVPNSAPEVLDAVTALSNRNPLASRQLVRAHIESVFNQSTKDLQGGPTQFGGATFRAKLVGNDQQAANLAAAISGLPNGQQVLQGFDRLMTIMEATGRRQRIGSQTAFNQELQQQLKEGGIVGEAVATGGIKLPQRIRETLQSWNIGRNTDRLANLLTDPNAVDAFRQLATAPSNSRRAALSTIRLVGLTSRGAKAANRDQENN